MPPFPASVYQGAKSADTWLAIFADEWVIARWERNGGKARPEGQLLTNADVITLIMAWMPVAGVARMPLWYQYAAAAYGWNPDADALDSSAAQAARWYPKDLLGDFWGMLEALANAMDADGVSGPSVSYDGVYQDISFQVQVRQALQQDGASAEWKVPLPACRDPKTGKLTLPKYNPKTKKMECPGGPVLVDDPVTAIGNAVITPFAVVALVVGALWLMEKQTRRTAARRY